MTDKQEFVTRIFSDSSFWNSDAHEKPWKTGRNFCLVCLHAKSSKDNIHSIFKRKWVWNVYIYIYIYKEKNDTFLGEKCM